ncbi:MAG: cyclic beta 1-2 glucan synthetase, partial [Planctomycetaceae bacterium]
MAVAPALAVLTAVLLAAWRPVALWAAAPLIVSWLLAPLLAWWISLPPVRREEKLTVRQTLFLHRLSRQTWRFFENFVGPEDHWLPPDNFQEIPTGTIAHRTSPTNIGVSLLSSLAAHDFGYIATGQLLERTAQTLSTMDQLERFHGHFLNWYDTRTLQPLYPKYVSSVDSGNLAGHLLTLRCGLLDLPSQPIVAARMWDSLVVTLQLLDERIAKSAAAPSTQSQSSRQPMGAHSADRVREVLRRECDQRSAPPRLSRVRDVFQKLIAVVADVSPSLSDRDDPELVGLVRDLDRQCRDHLADLTFVVPWLAHPAAPPEFWQRVSCGSALAGNRLREFLHSLDEVPSLRDMARFESRLLPEFDLILNDLSGKSDVHWPEDHAWLLQLRLLLWQASHDATGRILAIERHAAHCRELADLEFEFLYDKSRRLLSIGYNVSERRRDASYYDLLASEARLASFVGIAQGKLPQEHWFALGRLLTLAHGQNALLSWSGSMFEYLMPLLVMPTYRNTLLDQTCRAVIGRQIAYGRQRGVPWGVSESGYNATDAQLNYQYRAFGVPGLGFKRGLVDDLVVAPYATVMALMVAPEEACANLEHLAALGAMGRFGFYEAVDYTTSRLAPGQTSAIVRSHMSHHQGMSLLSLAYQLLGRPMQRRFAADPQFQAADLLLQERIPRVAPFYPHAAEVEGVHPATTGDRESLIRVFTTPQTPLPEVNLLSNGRYHVMVTNAGGGYSHWKDIAVTRWREDGTLDNAGMFCYLRDVQSGEVWSTAHQPTLKPARRYEAIFSQSRTEFRRRDGDFKIHTEIAVSPEDDVEIRRSTITNRSRSVRTIEFTSYAEVVLAPAIADAAHPAFSNLFVQTEIFDLRQAIVCTRRPRSHQEQPPWMLHLMAVRGALAGETSYETDRLKFVGRGSTLMAPAALEGGASLSNSSGSVLDPIVAIRRRLTLAPEETVVVDLVTGMADSRAAAVVLIDKYHDRPLADRAFEMAWTHGQVLLSQLNATEANAQLFGRLASAIVYANPSRRAAAATLLKNLRGQYGLWGHGISGDLPIVLLRIGDAEKIDLVRQLVQAHAYWRLKGLAVDLVIWNEGPAGYRQVLQDLILGLISAGIEAQKLDHPGGIFVRRAEQLSDEDRILMQTVARAIVVDTEGSLGEQLERWIRPEIKPPKLVPSRPRRIGFLPIVPPPHPDIVFFNGLGGFTSDGREYVIRLYHGQITPAPWVNVLANPDFGTVVSDGGAAYTWSENAHEFRLTPWNNDPVTDVSGEACYLRDEETGYVWSPTPRPAPGNQPYVCRHGFGYSVFEYTENGLSSEMWIYVAHDAPVKFAVLKVRNSSGRLRRLSATAYTEWVLGEMRSRSVMHVVTQIDANTGALLARNPYSME